MNTKADENHVHNFIYGGIRYKVDSMHYAGTSARPIYYYDWYYCTTCAECRFVRLSEDGHTFEKLKFNATPLPAGVKIA